MLVFKCLDNARILFQLAYEERWLRYKAGGNKIILTYTHYNHNCKKVFFSLSQCSVIDAMINCVIDKDFFLSLFFHLLYSDMFVRVSLLSLTFSFFFVDFDRFLQLRRHAQEKEINEINQARPDRLINTQTER